MNVVDGLPAFAPPPCATACGTTPSIGRSSVITHACDGVVQALTVLRMVPKGLAPVRRAVSTTVRTAASPSAAHMAR